MVLVKGFDSIKGLIDKEESNICFGNQVVTLADCSSMTGAKKYQVDLSGLGTVPKDLSNISKGCGPLVRERWTCRRLEQNKSPRR